MEDTVDPIHLIVSGSAGTGKSQLIRAIRQYLPAECLRVAAASGVAAYNVEGSTLHSLLKIPVNSNSTACIQTLGESAKRELQNSLRGVRYLIIDERSFVGKRLFAQIDWRLREAFPEPNKAFGGVSIILIGDDAQLPPVKDMPLYSEGGRDDQSLRGRALYLSLFKLVVELDAVFRQQDPLFVECLQRIRTATVTDGDLQLLGSRQQEALSADEARNFACVPRLYSTKAAVELYNMQQLARASSKHHPFEAFEDLPLDDRAAVAKIQARHTGVSRGTTVGSDRAGGLGAMLYIKVGARVMLKVNMIVALGLVNGALGTVVDIVYDRDRRPPDLPQCVLVQFDHLTGENISLVEDMDGVIPIRSVRMSYLVDRAECTRTQIPLAPAWAITVQK